MRHDIARQVALPLTLAPRLICREAAAEYVSVSPNIFDQMVGEGRMPKPRRLTVRRIAWDVRDLDRAIDLLPKEGEIGRLPVEDEDISPDAGWDHAT